MLTGGLAQGTGLYPVRGDLQGRERVSSARDCGGTVAVTTATDTPTLTNTEPGAQRAGVTKPEDMWSWLCGQLVGDRETDMASWQ